MPQQENLTLKEAIKLNYNIVSKFLKRELDEVKNLYEKEFQRLYIFGTRPYINDDNTDMKVNIRYLQRVPSEQIVYRPLDPNRVNQLVGQKRTMPSFHAALQHLVVLPLKAPPLDGTLDEPFSMPMYFSRAPTQ